jgi:sirohydrochlorin ferrochelatase
MNAILYICHGSRVKEASEQAVSFVKQVMNKIEVPIQEMAFLELSEPTISQSFERCVEQGATKIVVIPILLLTAAHAKKDIPEEIRYQQSRFPTVGVKIGSPIGVNDQMVDLLIEKIIETELSVHHEATVLLVGRGSSDPDVKRDLSIIGEKLKNKAKMARVEICFLAAANPTLQEGLLSVKQSGTKQVFIIPYLFFTGILMKKIQNTIEIISDEQGPEWVLCSYLGYHPIIETIICEQIDHLLGEKS